MDSQVAAKAVIVSPTGRALIMRQGERWEAPGGRLEPGEQLRDGLVREIREETGIVQLTIGEIIHVDEWFAKPEGVRKHIVGVFFACKAPDETVVLSEEHEEFAWVSEVDLGQYPLHPEMSAAIKRAMARG